jgi:class 3 adenylate cyclase/tetratricopeptide (TPR) repeat protein
VERTVNCSACGYQNLQDARFCSGCGVPLTREERSSGEGERRQITAIFCDIVGYTPLSQKLDPEELKDLVSTYHAVCSGVVLEHGGHISQYLGDGIVVFFGYPISQEDDVRRAVQCGLKLLKALSSEAIHPKPHASSQAPTIRVRIGIHTGRVVIASSGQFRNQQNLAHGDVTNIAARIQAYAQPHSLLVSDETWRIAGGYFIGRDLQDVTLKGLQHPMRLWEVLGTSASVTRLEAGGTLTGFVGRQKEISILEDRWNEVLSGRSRFVLIKGEAGIGKSRLAHHFLDNLKAGSIQTLEVCCSADTQNSPFMPLINLLRDQLQLADDDGEEESRQRLEAGLGPLGLQLEEAVPLIATLLGVPWEGQYPPLTLSPTRQRTRTIEILVAMVQDFSRRAPTVLLVEDLHWSDPSSLEVLTSLINAMPPIPLLVLFTARPLFQLPPDFMEGATDLRVAPLQGHEVEAMARFIALGKAVPGEVIRQIIDHCDGIPLFIEEVVRSVIDAGIMEEKEHTWLLNRPIPASMIPASIDALLSARIDQLGDARPTAQLAATIGREFSLQLLCAVSYRSEVSVRRDLRKIVLAGLAWEQSDGSARRYVFKHALIQQAAYQSLLQKTRRHHHAQIADVLLQDLREQQEKHRHLGGKTEVLAHHLSCAGRQIEAADYWLLAGRHSLSRVAVPEAHGHLSRGLEDLSQLPPSEEALHQELDLQIAIAPTLMTLQGWAAPSVARSCLRAEELCVQLQRHDKLYVPVWGLWTNRFVGGQLDDALDTARRVLEMAIASGNPMLEVTGRHAMAYSHYYRGEWLAAIEHANKGLALFSLQQEQELTTTFQISSSVNLHATLGSCQWMLGQQEVGVGYIDSMIDLARSIGHPSALSNALGVACYMLTFHHDFPRMALCAREVCSFAREEGLELWYAVGVLFGGWAQLRMGKTERGLEEMFEGLELFSATRSGLMETTIAVAHAEALVAAGRPGEAAAVLAQAAERAREGHVGVLLPEVYRLRGRILMTLDDPDGAREEVLQALRTAREQGATSLELRAALEFCRLPDQDRPGSEAREHLQRCFGGFTEGFHHQDLLSAARILEGKQLSGRAAGG